MSQRYNKDAVKKIGELTLPHIIPINYAPKLFGKILIEVMTVSYATMQDVLFDLRPDRSELRDRPRRHSEVPARPNHELLEGRGVWRRVAQPKAVDRR